MRYIIQSNNDPRYDTCWSVIDTRMKIEVFYCGNLTTAQTVAYSLNVTQDILH